MTLTIKNKQNEFNKLIASVENCNKCKRMCNRKKVLSENNGNINSKVMFIAEAPGRLGAEQTGIPLYGDKTGKNFEKLLSNIGWKREDVFITNAVLCNPQNEKGNNSTPTDEEIENCSEYLRKTIELVNPEFIVTLGINALETLKYLERHNYILKKCVTKKLSWNGRYVFPLYHPSPKGMLSRRFEEQVTDFRKLLDI
jgi:DNA polymerase